MQQTGEKQIDRLLEVWVVVEDISVPELRVVVEDLAVPELRLMVAKFGAWLGQEAMYFDVGTSTVEFIPSLPQESQTNEPRGGAAPTS